VRIDTGEDSRRGKSNGRGGEGLGRWDAIEVVGCEEGLVIVGRTAA
jgi:hypothetical protein